MKGSEFIKLLRKVIREEVRDVVREELKSIKPMIIENKTRPTIKQVAPQQKMQQKPQQKPQYTIDGAFSRILKETADSMNSNHATEMEDWPDMNGGLMTSEQLTPAMNYSAPSNNMQSHSSDPTAGLMRDYSAVLKSADAISQNTYRG